MATHQNMVLVFDQELSESWSRLHERINQSFSGFMKEILVKENLKYATFCITDAVKNISGTLNTKLEYKELREQMSTDQLHKYENLS